MSIRCLLFGHRPISGDIIVIIGDYEFLLGVCVRCQTFVAKPYNDKSRLLFLTGEL
jgi:hypothetical protein